MRKTLILILSVVALISAFAVSVSAAEAKVGEEEYETLQEAITNANEGDVVTLLEDVTLNQILTINKPITLDGNGKTLTSTAGRAINVETEGSVKIHYLTINASGERAINVIQKTVDLTISNVNATAANYAVNVAGSSVGSVVLIADSTLKGLSVVNVGAVNTQVTIEGGTIICDDNNDSENYGAITLNQNATNSIVTANGVAFEINGDSLKASNSAENGEIIIDGAEEEKAAAFIQYGDQAYSFITLDEAIQYASNGDTIVIANDIVLDAPIVVSAGKNITLELNGKSISYESNVAGEDMITNYGNLTIKGEGALTYKNTDTTASNVTTSVITNNPGATLTINGGSFINETSDAKAWQSGGIFPFVIDNVTNGSLGDTTLVINDGYFAGNYRTIRAFCNSTTCKNTVVINGGMFEGQVWMQSSNVKANISNLEITDGSFRPVGNDGSSVYIATSTATEATVTGGTYETRIGVDNTDNLSGFVSGGTFGSAVKDELCAEGFVPVQNDDGSYGVAVKEITLEDIFAYKGVSTDGSSITTGYTIDHANLEKYVAQNGIEAVEFGGTMAIEKISNGTLDFDFTNLAKTLNYNIIIRDVTEEYYDLPLIMTIYVSFDGSAKKYVSKEGTLVESDKIVAVSYNEIA